MQIEDRIAEELNKVYNEKQEQVKCLLKRRIEQQKYGRKCFIEKYAKNHYPNNAELEQAEETRHLKQVEEHEKKYQMREREEELKRKLNREQRNLDYTNFLKRKEQLILEQKEIFNWELLNRLKNSEINEELIKQANDLKIKKQKEMRQALNNQIKDQNTIKEQDKIQDNRYNTLSYDLEDQFYFEYADQLIQHAKSKCRPIYPLQKAILTYKNLNGLDS